jgi:hypothetical protein
MKQFKRFPYNRFPKTGITNKKGIPNPNNKDQDFITPEYKETVRVNSYIGKKGYTIQKAALHTNDYEFLKKDLYMIPFTMGPSFGNSEDANFPVYRENAAKIYVPRFYGIKRYGLPDTSELSEGEDIDIAFVKELRDYQTNVVNIYLKQKRRAPRIK